MWLDGSDEENREGMRDQPEVSRCEVCGRVEVWSRGERGARRTRENMRRESKSRRGEPREGARRIDEKQPGDEEVRRE